MVTINYDENSVITARDEIIESLNNIFNELSSIDTILNTPKSNEPITRYNEYIKDRIDYVNNKKDRYNVMFNSVIEKYESYINGVKGVVGDNND